MTLIGQGEVLEILTQSEELAHAVVRTYLALILRLREKEQFR